MIFREHHWDTLLSYLKDGTLAPVIGRELTRVPVDQVTRWQGDKWRRIAFDLQLARRFAADEDLPLPAFDAARFFAEQRSRFARDGDA